MNRQAKLWLWSVCLLSASLGVGSVRADSIFGDDGNDRCGLGSMLWGSPGSICSQNSEVSTNQYFGETLSMTTGTSECSNSGITKATQEELLYANANFEELKSEMAEGKGEVLLGLAETLGCRSADSRRFVDLVRGSYDRIVPEDEISASVFLSNVKQTIQMDHELAKHCQGVTL